ncbi:acyl-CoA dehydrogenase family protein [Siccirubricoccus deserti]
MDFGLSPEQSAIVDGVTATVRRFGDDYWRDCEAEARFPREFHRAMAEGGWLGITMPQEYGGAGLGVTEAALVMHSAARHGGGMGAASSLHINMFGPHPIVVHGTQEQKARFLPPLIAGTDQACFGFTEPNAGLDTTSITTFATKVPGGYRVNGRKIWTSTGQVANKIMLLTRTTKRRTRGGRRMASPCSTPTSTAAGSRCSAFRRWAAPPSIRTWSSSMTSSSRRRIASARKAAASPMCSTA